MSGNWYESGSGIAMGVETFCKRIAMIGLSSYGVNGLKSRLQRISQTTSGGQYLSLLVASTMFTCRGRVVSRSIAGTGLSLCVP